MADRRHDNEARYDRMAGYYTRLLRTVSFGTITRLYRAAAAAIDVPAGGTVVEVGCGPATLTPHLREALADGVRIIGVDLSGEMIARARQEAERRGWADVRFEKSDVAGWQPPGPIDAVVFSLALTAFPDPLGCVDRVLSWLRPGGQLVVLDSFLVPGRGFSNWLVRLKAPAVGAVPEDLPLDALLGRLDAPETTSLFGGAYLLVSGRRTAAT